MSDPSPWDEISVPSTDFNVRQDAAKTVVPCLWGRDASGACLFIVKLQGDNTDQYRRNVVTVNGVHVDLRAGENGQQRLVLALERHVDRDLFEGLCRTLVLALQQATDSASALAVSLANIRRWKAFLAGRGQHLSAEGVRGLFAELLFLGELLDRKMPSNNAVDAWLGPERSHQDFIFENTAVEVKSLSGAERNSIRISSEDQLESLNDALYLRIYRLNSIADAPTSRSLNDLVTEVQARLDDAEAVESFDRKLAAHGYAPLPGYDAPRFVVSEIRNYLVTDDFPRIIRSQIPEGIGRVAYDIKLEAIAKYECEKAAAFGGM